MVWTGRARGVGVAAFVAMLLFGLAGCGAKRRQVGSTAEPPRSAVPGVWHEVAAGQTLWRIARVYGVDLDELARSNAIADPTSLAVGQRLFVPGARATRDVPPYPAPLVPQDPAWTSRTGRDFLWPVENGRVLSGFGTPRGGRRHGGIDIGGEPGDAVRAAQSGRVVYSGSTLRGYGRTVIVDHGGELSTLYAHNAELLAREGDRVERGQLIGRLGRTGNATTDHCHFEIREHQIPVDPLRYLQALAEDPR